MIYFDNAATTWPKPPEVKTAVAAALDIYGANPGRGSYEMALRSSRLVFETRSELAEFFNAPDPSRMIFTANATEAMNLALHGFLKPGDHAVFTGMEHNAVYRPLKALEQMGVALTMAAADACGLVHPENIHQAFRPETKLLVVNHISNVTGTIQPLDSFAQLAREHGVRLLVDAAQSAGFMEIDVQKQGIDLLAFPGHKGLYGPPGTGGLYISPEIELEPIIQGGTGSKSHSWEQPRMLPDRFESGSLNTLGIAGLKAGLDFVSSRGIKNIRDHEWSLTSSFLNGLNQLPQVTVYGPPPEIFRAPVVSLNIEQRDPGEISFMLDKMYGIATRSGFHCAPLAHQAIGTAERGTVRFSFAYYNTLAEIQTGLSALREIIRELEK